ncbi:nitronate monooxygenase [Hoeflea sp. CAU 1731]|nr:nitronate monooxygenase [Paracoccaceae bacterium]
MTIDLMTKLGIETPIFAFSHCRDVVVEVSRAGGFGVLGAVMFPPDQLEQELDWIDRHTDGKPYGIDFLIPANYSKDAEESELPLLDMVPAQHRDFVTKLLDDAGIPRLPDDQAAELKARIAKREKNLTPAGARELLKIARKHPNIRMYVSALGPMPTDLVDELHGEGIVVGALCGKPEHVKHHRAAGADVLIAQGGEAGGHTGTVPTFMLVPQIVEAAAGDMAVLAAGGINRGSQIAAAQAMGAQGVWTGSIWLTTMESELSEFEREAMFRARADDAVRRKVLSGKPVRMLRSKLSEAFEAEGAPAYLPAPLQGLLFLEARARIDRAENVEYYTSPVGQVVGEMNEATTVRDVMYKLQLEYVEALEKLAANPALQALQ